MEVSDTDIRETCLPNHVPFRLLVLKSYSVLKSYDYLMTVLTTPRYTKQDDINSLFLPLSRHATAILSQVRRLAAVECLIPAFLFLLSVEGQTRQSVVVAAQQHRSAQAMCRVQDHPPP